MTRHAILCALLLALPSYAADPPYVVDRADVAQVVRERGALEAANSVDIVAPPGGTKEKPLVIKWVVEDGTHIKKGDRLIEFDAGALREQLTVQQVAADQANAVVTVTDREMRISLITIEKELRSATAAVELAELVAKNSAEADALAKQRLELKVRQADVAIQKAKLTLKGENTEVAKLAVLTAELEREAATLELKQFALSGEPNRKQAELRVREARDELELAKLRGDQRRAQAEANLQAAKVALLQERTRLDAIAKDVQSCIVVSPTDGLVLFADFVRANRGPIVAVGEPVMAGQKLLRIPDLRRMKVETRISEAQVSQVRPGQITRVMVDAFPNGHFEGCVASISPTAAPPDFRNRDVKLYPVTISVPQTDAPLKPGMSAEVQIFTGLARNALRVPVAAVVRTAGKATCAVDAPGGVREATVVTGVSDGRFVEIREGLKEGDKVLLPTKK